MNSITRRIAIAAAVVALAAGFAATPASAGSLITAPVVTPSSVEPGGDFTVSGVADCIQDENLLTLTIDGLGLEQDFDGTSAWSVDFTVPEDAAPGQYPIEVVHSECSFPTSYVTVLAASTTTTSSTVAPTTTSTAAPAEKAAVAAQPAFTG